MKKNWLSRMSALVLALVLVMSLLAGCGGGGSEVTTPETPEATTSGDDGTEEGTVTESEESTEAPVYEITYPLENAGSLTWYGKDELGLPDDVLEVEDSPFHTKLSELTGVDIEWRFPPIGASSEQDFNLLLTEEKLPHIISGKKTNYDQMYEEGLVYDLRPYLEQYAPDYWAWLTKEENKDIFNSLKLNDGAIVGFVCGVEELNCYSKGPIIRKDWLDECGLDIPYTLEDWETVLTAFKDRYNVYPFSAIGVAWGAMYGLASGTNAQGGINLRLYVEDGVVKCAQLQEEWQELITILARWYENGLIHPDVTSDTKKSIRTKCAAGEIGMALVDEARVTLIIEDARAQGSNAEWISIPHPVPQKGDPVVYTTYEGVDMNRVTFITTSCTEEELITAVKLLNYGYTEDGINFYNYGIEGESWEYDENGVIQLTESLLSQYESKIFALKQYSRMSNIMCPSIKTNHYPELIYDQASLDAFANWGMNSITREYALPTLRYTAEESDARADKITAIETFLAPYAEKIILGEIPIDENTWTYMEEQMNVYGIQEVLKIAQDAYDRAFGK